MLALCLPESPRFLAQKANLSWRQAALLDPPASHVPDRQDPSISAAEDTRGRSPACLVALTATFEQLGQRQQFRLEAIGRLSLAGAGHAHVIDNQLQAGVALGNLADGRQKHRCAEYHGTWARSVAGHSQSRVSSQSGFGDIGIMLQYADRQDYAEHQGWRYLVKNQELF